MLVENRDQGFGLSNLGIGTGTVGRSWSIMGLSSLCLTSAGTIRESTSVWPAMGFHLPSARKLDSVWTLRFLKTAL